MAIQTFKIKGMHCASCAVTIEKAFKKTEGVGSAEVNYGTETAKVDFDGSRTSAREIPLPSPALAYLDTIGFYNLKNVLEGPSFEEKICSYSDMRVGPYGVLLLEERLAEANKRYAGRNHPLGSDKFDTLADAVREIENQIFGQTDIKPEDITDQKIQRAIVELKDLRIA